MMQIKQGIVVTPMYPVGRPPRKAGQGTVLYIDGSHACVQFEENIDGHNGGFSPVKGKNGHCWWVDISELTSLSPVDNQSAASLLKEDL